MAEFFLPLVLFAGLVAAYLWIAWKFPPAIFLIGVAYSAITKTVSCLYLELNPTFLVETGVYSSASGATWRQLLFNSALIGSALLVIWWRERSRPTVHVPALQGLSLAALLGGGLLAVQFLNVLISPNVPLFTGESRQEFWAYYIRIPVLRDVLGVLVIFVPAVASYLAGLAWIIERPLYKRALWLAAIPMFIGYFAFLIVSGQKFNGLLGGVFLACAPFYVLAKASSKRIPVSKWGARGLFVLVLVLLVSVIGFSERSLVQTRGFADGLAYRAFALQGGVYFTADLITKQTGGGEPISLLFGDMEQTIRALAPSGLAEAYIYKGVNLAGSLPGSASLVFGFAGAIPVLILYGALLGFVASVFARRVTNGRVFQVFLLAYILVWVSAGYASGGLDEVIDPKFILFAAGLLMMEASSAGPREWRKRASSPGHLSSRDTRPERRLSASKFQLRSSWRR